MNKPFERADAYLDALEADRQAALVLSQEKAEEAKLLQAQIDGFRAALNLFGGHFPEGDIRVSNDPPAPAAKEVEEPARRRRTRRNIPELIRRELSFSGQAMTARQIARAIEYPLKATETTLERMEKAGQVSQQERGRWTLGMATTAHLNGHAARAGDAST